MEEADEDATSEKKSDNGDVRSLLSGSDDGADDEERVNNKVSEFQWDPSPTISLFWAIF